MAIKVFYTRNTKATKKVLNPEIQSAVRSLKRGESAHFEELSMYEIIQTIRWYRKGYAFKIDDMECIYNRRLITNRCDHSWQDYNTIFGSKSDNQIYYIRMEDKHQNIWYSICDSMNARMKLTVTRKKIFYSYLKAPKKLFKHFDRY